MLPPVHSHARKTSTPVAFTSMALNTISAKNEASPYLNLASYIMQNKVLHKKIREQGGAYGAGASYNVLNGNFHMYAYRDPHIASTLEAFGEAISTVQAGHFHESDLEEAKLSLIQHMDTPLSPGARGNEAYVHLRDNLQPTCRQEFRKIVLEASCDNIKHTVETYLSFFMQQATIVSFCGEDLLKKENATMPNKLPILPI